MLVNKTMEKIQSRNFAVNLMTPIKTKKDFFKHSIIEQIEYECDINKKVRIYFLLIFKLFIKI